MRPQLPFYTPQHSQEQPILNTVTKNRELGFERAWSEARHQTDLRETVAPPVFGGNAEPMLQSLQEPEPHIPQGWNGETSVERRKRLEDSLVLSFPLVTGKLVAKATWQMCEHTPAQQDLLPLLGKALLTRDGCSQACGHRNARSAEVPQ